jgi:hypothetical protein
MNDQVSCAVPTITIDGVPYDRVRYVDTDRLDGDTGDPKPCPDCWAPDGTLHHPGCDVEECPACGGQGIGCGCIWDSERDAA